MQSNTTSLQITAYGKMTKTQENITYKRAKRSALSQLVTTGLQATDKTAKKNLKDKEHKGPTKEELSWNGH